MDIEGLLRSQVADVGRAIVRYSFSPSEFAATVVTDHAAYMPLPAIRHSPSGSWFGFGRYTNQRGHFGPVEDLGFLVFRSPGREQPVESRGPVIWSTALEYFTEWLSYVRREIDASDIWSELEASSDSGADTPDVDAKPYSAPEQNEILDRLTQIEEALAASVRQSAEMDEYIKREFAELRAELAKASRGRWKKMFLGTVASMAMRHIVPDGAVRTALEMSRDFFVHTVLPSLPPGP